MARDWRDPSLNRCITSRCTGAVHVRFSCLPKSFRPPPELDVIPLIYSYLLIRTTLFCIARLRCAIREINADWPHGVLLWVHYRVRTRFENKRLSFSWSQLVACDWRDPSLNRCITSRCTGAGHVRFSCLPKPFRPPPELYVRQF